MSTQAYHIKSWSTNVLIDPDGVVRGVMHPGNLTVELVKDSAHRRPLPVPADRRPPTPRSRRYSTPTAPAFWSTSASRPDVACTLAVTTWACNRKPTPERSSSIAREEAGGWYKSPRARWNVTSRNVNWPIGSVPKGGRLAVRSLRPWRRPSASAFGLTCRREQDVWVLVRVGTATPAAPEGPLDRGSTMYAKNYNIGENSSLVDIANFWVELYWPGLRVLDETGLEGKYDWTLKVRSHELEDLNAALKPLGLPLRPACMQVPYLVVSPPRVPTGKPRNLPCRPLDLPTA